MSHQQKSDLQIANETLITMKPNITFSDRLEAPVSAPTIDRYLSGQGKKLSTAIELIQHFRGRIEERRKILNEA